MLVTFGICFKQHFDTRYLAFCNLSPPRMFLPLDLLSEYWIQHGAIRPLYVTSTYSTWIFCRGVLGFANDCPCGIWCCGLTTCLLRVDPPFWKSTFKQQLGCRFDIIDSTSSIFFVFLLSHVSFSCPGAMHCWQNCTCLDTSYHFRLYLYFWNNVLYFFKHSCSNIFHRCSLYTFYKIKTKACQTCPC